MKKFSSFSDNVKLVKPSRAQSTWRLWKSLPGFIRLGSERIPTQDIFGMEDERSFALEFDRREGILAHTLTSNPDKKCNFNFQFCHQSSFYFNINLFIALHSQIVIGFFQRFYVFWTLCITFWNLSWENALKLKKWFFTILNLCIC